MASRGSADHRGLLKRSSLEDEPFFILDILLLLRNRVIVGSMLEAGSECKQKIFS